LVNANRGKQRKDFGGIVKKAYEMVSPLFGDHKVVACEGPTT